MRAHRLVQAEYIRISAISKVRLRLMIRSPTWNSSKYRVIPISASPFLFHQKMLQRKGDWHLLLVIYCSSHRHLTVSIIKV